jgi:hypothetical protein
MILKQALIAFFLTPLFFASSVFFTEDTNAMNWFILTYVITLISFGLPNVIFLLFLHWIKIGAYFLHNTYLLISEIVLLFGTFYVVNKVMVSIDPKYRFHTEENGEQALRFPFRAEMIILNSFIVLFLVISVIHLIQKKKRS